MGNSLPLHMQVHAKKVLKYSCEKNAMVARHLGDGIYCGRGLQGIQSFVEYVVHC